MLKSKSKFKGITIIISFISVSLFRIEVKVSSKCFFPSVGITIEIVFKLFKNKVIGLQIRNILIENAFI